MSYDELLENEPVGEFGGSAQQKRDARALCAGSARRLAPGMRRMGEGVAAGVARSSARAWVPRWTKNSRSPRGMDGEVRAGLACARRSCDLPMRGRTRKSGALRGKEGGSFSR